MSVKKNIYTRTYCSCGGKLAFDENTKMQVCNKCNKRFVPLEVKNPKDLLIKYKIELEAIIKNGLK